MFSLGDLQSDLVNPQIPLSVILRKTKIFAYELKSEEFKKWVEYEMDGYYGFRTIDELKRILPSYRVVTSVEIYCNVSDGFRMIENLPFNVPRLEEFKSIRFTDSIPTLERLLNSEGEHVMAMLDQNDLELINKIYESTGFVCIQGRRQCSKSAISHIVETVKNKVLSFTLELQQKYPELNKNSSVTQTETFQEQVRHIFYITVAEGGKMSVFDQRNQNVSGDQYNAAGNVNFGNASSKDEFTAELVKLQALIKQAADKGDIDQEMGLDADYQVTKAILQAKKSEPDKNILLTHLNSLKEIVAGVAGLIAASTAVAKAIEVIPALFH